MNHPYNQQISQAFISNNGLSASGYLGASPEVINEEKNEDNRLEEINWLNTTP